MRKVCQHAYLGAPTIDEEDSKLPMDEQHKRLIAGSGKMVFLKLLLPKLKERGHRVLLFSQVS
jgi:SNF2 family DNA or RNA helicase